MTTPVTDCYSVIRGRAMRVTKLDACGNPVPGARNQVASKGFITVGLTANNDEGTTIQTTNANGDICIRDVPAPRFLNYTVSIELCDVNPDLVSLLTGNDLVLDADDNRVGFDVGTDVDLSEIAFALEVWSVVPGEECTDGIKSFAYMLLPFVQGGQFGDFTIGNDAVTFTVAGATTKDGAGWGVGPYNVQLDEDGDPGPLVAPIGAKKHLRQFKTKVPPPSTVNCGAGPVGTAATSATAGIPGTYGPSGSYGPDNLTALQASGITKTPGTAWTTGQYITLGDGSKAHWTGSAWAAGPA